MRFRNKSLMTLLKNLLKASGGLILVLFYHIPRLLLSYKYTFNNVENLTADPKEHIKRAKKLLAKNNNSVLLYAALELRFAIERLVKTELSFADKVSNSTWRKNDPAPQAKALRALDQRADFSHEIFFVSKHTKEKISMGIYKPLPIDKINKIEGRLGDLLHAKIGLSLGKSNDPWYVETRAFLQESADYLESVAENNVPFFAYANDKKFEIIRRTAK